jgi:hypothetical protein
LRKLTSSGRKPSSGTTGKRHGVALPPLGKKQDGDLLSTFSSAYRCIQANRDHEKVFEGIGQFPDRQAGMQQATKISYLFKILYRALES